MDSTYGDHGRVIYVGAGTHAWAMNSLQDSDGKTVTVGYTQAGPNDKDFSIARFNDDGGVDTSFGVSGHVQIDFGESNEDDHAYGIAEQSDGKLIVVGYTTSASQRMAVVRLNTDGSLDTSFDTDGKVTITIGTSATAMDALVQSDGNIVIAGSATISSSAKRFVFTRLLTDGSVDTAYGTSGTTQVTFQQPETALNRAILQSDGKVVAVGRDLATYTRLAVRLDADGSVDTTFTATGMISVSCYYGPCEWLGVSQQSDGKLIFSGYDSTYNYYSGGLRQETSVVARYNSNGTQDYSFYATSNIFSLAYGVRIHISERAVGTVVDGSGRIYVLGTTTGPMYDSDGQPVTSGWSVVVARLTSNGSLDSTFGRQGTALVPFGLGNGAQSTFATRIHLLSDGRLLLSALTGEYGVDDQAIQQATGLARLRASGSDPGVLVIEAPARTISESIGTAYFRVSRRGGSSGAISVSYATVDGTAAADVDFTVASGTLEWASGDSSVKYIPVTILDDDVSESVDKTFEVQLSNPQGSVGLAKSSALVAIARDDIEPGNSITVSQQAITANEGQSVNIPVTRTGSTAVSMNYAVIPGTATESDYNPTYGILTWSAGDTSSKNISVYLNPDGQAEPIENFTVLLFASHPSTVIGGTNVTVNVVSPVIAAFGQTSASVSESQSQLVILVTLSGPPIAPITVGYSTSSGSATAGADFTHTAGTLSWAAGESAAKSITIPLLPDQIFEAYQYSPSEYFYLQFTGVTGPVATNYGSVSISITDDDPPPQIAFTQTSVSINETDGTAMFTLARNGGTAFVHAVTYTIYVGSATAADYTAPATGTITWLPTDPVNKTINVSIVNDSIREGNETFSIGLANPTNQATLGVNSLLAVTIVDDEPQPQVGFALESITVDEGAAEVALTVLRVGTSPQPIAVTYATQNGTATEGQDYTATGGSLTWAPTDPDTKTIIIPLVGDSITEANESFAVNLTLALGDAVLTTRTVIVNIVDNDAPPPPPPPPPTPEPTPPASSGGRGGGSMLASWMALLLIVALARVFLVKSSSCQIKCN